MSSLHVNIKEIFADMEMVGLAYILLEVNPDTNRNRVHNRDSNRYQTRY